MGTSGKGFRDQTEVMKILLLILGLGTLACYGSPLYGYRSGALIPALPLELSYIKPAPALPSAPVVGYGNIGYRGLQDTGLTGVSEGIMDNLVTIGTQGKQLITDIIKQILANVLNQAQGGGGGPLSPSGDSSQLPEGRRYYY